MGGASAESLSLIHIQMCIRDRIHITLPDGSVRTFEQEQITPLEVAKNISNGLAKKAIVAKVNGNLCSLGQPINEDASVSIYTFDDPEAVSYTHLDVYKRQTNHCSL